MINPKIINRQSEKNMACPSDVTTGFVTIQGPIQQSDLNGITVPRHPLTTSFSPRTSEPSIFNKNYIDDTVGSTCLYKSSKYNLSDIQIAQPIHTGYTLPGNRQTPKAELILSFSANSPALSLADYSGILMCIPIYDSGAPSHDAYLNQLIDTSTPLCKHTRNPGKDYTTDNNTKAKRTIQNTTLTECINAACNDSKCVAYTYKNKTSYLYYEIPKETNATNQDIISGTIDHTTAPVITNTCSTNNTNNTNAPPQLESIFNNQTSFAYKTCFETVDSTKTLESHSLYVIVFPKGITMASANYVLLSTKIGNPSRYRCPVSIRGADPTLLTYRFDDSGNKTSVTTSSDGYIYTSPLSSCTAEFRDRIEFFEHAPKPTSSSSSSSGNDKCKYTRAQYKCVPLSKVNELHEGDNTSKRTIDQCINDQNIPTTPKSYESSIQEMETLAGVVGSVVGSIVIAVAIFQAYKAYKGR